MSWPGGKRFGVAITFDGAYAQTLESVASLLDGADIPVTWYVVAGAVGGTLEGRAVAGWADLRALDRHEIGNHTLTHPHVRLPLRRVGVQLTDPRRVVRRVRRVMEGRPRVRATDDPLDPVNRSRGVDAVIDDALLGHRVIEWQLGRAVRSFACPGGFEHPRLARTLLRAGYSSVRGSRSGINAPNEFDRSSVRAHTWTSRTTPGDVSAWTDAAEASGGLLVEIHHLVGKTSDYPWTVSPDLFAARLDELLNRGAWLGTVGQAVAQLRGTSA